MENLKELEKIMFEKYSDKFVFFKILGPIVPVRNSTRDSIENSIDDIVASSVSWYTEDDDDILDITTKFLDMAAKVGAKIIYYYESFPANREKFAEHAGEIAGIDFGFIYDGIMHTLSLRADWYNFLEDD